MSAARRFELSLLPERFAVAQLAPGAPFPTPAAPGELFSVTRTSDELSLVCPESSLPDSLRSHTGWRAFRVQGPFALSEIGVLSAIAAPLADAKISLFVISTFNTDYVLIHAEQLQSAISALLAAGHKIQQCKAVTVD
jgi:hypothetical protein